MDWFVRAFIKASLAWFGAGIVLGLAMAVYPPFTVYRTVHLHLNLLGFVGQMIYGVSLHVVPRFFGHALVHRRLAEAQFWLAQAGLALLAAGFVGRVHAIAGTPVVLGAGALLSAAAAACYIVNLWRTIDASTMTPLGRTPTLPLMPQRQAD